MSAAKHADLLFVKEMSNGDSDLAAYCKEQNIDHVSFKDLYVYFHIFLLSHTQMSGLPVVTRSSKSSSPLFRARKRSRRSSTGK